MKVLVQLNHPAHYHLYKNLIRILKDKGHDVLVTSRNKDVLEDLLSGTSHITLKSTRGKTLLQKIKQYSIKTKELMKIVDEFLPDITVGTAAELSVITRKKGIPSIFLAEDDANLNLPIFLVALTCYPFFSEIITPQVCYNSIWDKGSIKYNGYQKLAYLHPNYFTPDRNIIAKYLPVDKPYFIIRLSELNAYHDIGVKGISSEILIKLIAKLEKHGDIYISAEGKLDPQFEHFKIKINPSDMHHFLAFASIYMGDSQSMAIEAAMLGTPSIRFNDFVGKISVLEELEHKYELTTGIKSSDPEGLYKKIDSILALPDIKEEFQAKRRKMLSDKIDLTAFMVWFVENYPQSKKIMKQNPDYQYNFR